jgi:hypothetical protein
VEKEKKKNDKKKSIYNKVIKKKFNKIEKDLEYMIYGVLEK